MLPKDMFARLVEDQAASGRPYSVLARGLGLLTVCGSLGAFHSLARSGEVLIDRDDGVLHPADSVDREFAYVQAARGFPQLRDLMPVRPPSARTCDRCGGSGKFAINMARNLVHCSDCNTRGWTAEL